jgi:hypothetical protein
VGGDAILFPAADLRTRGKAMKRRRRLSFEAQVLEVREELLRLGVSERTQTNNLSTSVNCNDQATTRRELMAAAHELAGYVVATLALGRSIPRELVLQEKMNYDLGRCSTSDLDTIWAVGHLARERSRKDGCPGDAGLVDITVKMEGPVIGEVEDQNPEDILEENWKEIARVAQLLIEKGKPSREDIEAEVFEPDEDEK